MAADQAILEAALQLFIDRGLAGASIDEIARRAGVTRATVYRRWRSKAQLVAEAVGKAREGEGPGFEDWSEVGAEQFVRVMLDVVPRTLARPDLAPLAARLAGEARAHPELLHAYWDGYLGPRRATFSRALEAMQAQGRLPSGANPQVLQDMISGALLYRLLLAPASSVEEWRAYCRDLLTTLGFSPG